MKNSLMLENSVLTLYSTVNDGTNRLFINNTLIPSSNWVGTGTYSFQNITIHKAAELTGNLMLKKITDYEYFFVNVGLKKIYASEVIFDGSESGILADNVQDAIDSIFGKIYPVGALYFSAVDVNPGTFLGGTWERWGAGRVVTGYDSTDSDFNAAEKVGGSKTRSYTPAGTVGSKSLTYGGTVGTRSITPSGTVGSKSITPSGTVGGHKLTTAELPIVKFRIPHVAWYDSCAISGCTETHTAMSKEGQSHDVSNTGWHNIQFGADSTHNHSFTGTASSHDHSFTGTTKSHDHPFTGITESHDHSFTGTSSNLNCIQPYITCFIWKRTA